MYDRSSGTFGNGQITAGSFRKTGQEVLEIAQNHRSLEPGARPLPGIRAVHHDDSSRGGGEKKEERHQTTGFHVHNRGLCFGKSQITAGSFMKAGRLFEVL
jgi:hypothetical protein